MNNASNSNISHRLSVAPMMRTTHRHFRWFMRRMSRHTMLYTEMQSSGSILHGPGRGMEYAASELPLALQVGGSDPADMARCAVQAQHRGFSEININAGCPSEKVRNANFGACLFRNPQLLADCVSAMRIAADIPVTVKTRIGVDEMDAPEHLHDFVERLANAGCEVFIIHARKAWLNGLNPRQNRTIPPLCYERVRQLKLAFPHLQIILNGGMENIRQGLGLMQGVDGVMLGRSIVKDPWQLLEADELYFADCHRLANQPGKAEIIADYLDYMITESSQGVPYSKLIQVLLHTVRDFPGARGWRQGIVDGGATALGRLREQLPQSMMAAAEA